MKLLTKSILLAFIISVVFSQAVFTAECDDMSEKLLRLHILANSDSEEDQNLKLKVRDEILAKAGDLFVNAENKASAEKITRENLDLIVNLAQQYVYDCGYNYKVSGELVNMYFDTRHYDNFTLPAGQYDALRITIGKAEGKNWWCVMFPPMCFSSAEETSDMDSVLNAEQVDIIENETKYEYKFKTVEIFNDIVNFFSGN